jgi:NADPH:quinone reductase-like Zn-dependent oxidoreductase
LCAGKEIKFEILDVSRNKVGEIVNVYNGCFKEACTKEDKFVVRFPPSATFEDKVLLLHAAIALDFDIFEDTCPHIC